MREPFGGQWGQAEGSGKASVFRQWQLGPNGKEARREGKKEGEVEAGRLAR